MSTLDPTHPDASERSVHQALMDIIARNEDYYPRSTVASALVMVPPYLRAMGEPSLAPGNPVTGDSWRFISLPSFSPPIAVRIDDSGMTARAWLGPPVAGRGMPILDEARALTPSERQTFDALCAATRYWQMTPSGGAQGLDGTFWVLEARRGDVHHVVVRWSPDTYGSEPDFVRLGQFMLGLPSPVVLPELSADARREAERQRRVEQENRAAEERSRTDAIARSNQLAEQARADLARGQSVSCPHCRRQSAAMRFVGGNPDRESYFVCGLCGRSSTGREVIRSDLS